MNHNTLMRLIFLLLASHTPAEWESAAHSVGAYATKNIGEMYVTGQFFKSASKVAQGIAQNIRGFDQVAREVALSAQLTGVPAGETLTQTIARLHRVENIATKIGSRHISGITALHPELVKRVIMNEGGQLIEVATQAIADGTSTVASHAATILQLGKQLGHSLSKAKPGFIDLGGGEQQTTETNSPSSSLSSSSGYVAATQEAAERTGQIAFEKGRVIVNDVVQCQRVGSALKNDIHHAFDDIIDNYAGYAEEFSLQGNDLKIRKLFQIEGSLNGVDGIFEWIVEPQTQFVTHRLFIKHGNITGKPNVRKG